MENEPDIKRPLNLLNWVSVKKLFLISIRTGLLDLKSRVDGELDRMNMNEQEQDFYFENGEVKENDTRNRY